MTDTWASLPSPPLDSLSSESSSALLVDWHIVFTFPRRLWNAYVAYLWCYQPDSWVGRIASAFRILAIVLILPVVLLTLLDVTSYVIARTLGVVDDLKASTSDAVTTTADDGQERGRVDVDAAVPVSARVSTGFMSEGPARGSEGLAPEDSVEVRSGRVVGSVVPDNARAGAQAQTRDRGQTEIGTQRETGTQASQAYYFAGDLRLAGEGVFSPAVSMPPSPLAPRMSLQPFTESDGKGSGQVSEDEGVVLRRRVPGTRQVELAHA